MSITWLATWGKYRCLPLTWDDELRRSIMNNRIPTRSGKRPPGASSWPIHLRHIRSEARRYCTLQLRRGFQDCQLVKSIRSCGRGRLWPPAGRQGRRPLQILLGTLRSHGGLPRMDCHHRQAAGRMGSPSQRANTGYICPRDGVLSIPL